MPLSYAPVGLANDVESGFTVDELATVVGAGDAAFARAKQALRDWAHVDLGWVEVLPRRAPVEPGTSVAVLARHVGCWSLNACRVVYLVGEDSQTEFGFAYGTLANHAEKGEEIFKVTMRPDTGEVSYVIRAASMPHSPFVWLGYPVARMFQARFRRDSANAVRRAIGA